MPAGNVSSSSTLQIFREAGHLWWLLCRQSLCSVISLHSGMSRAVQLHPQELLKVDVDRWHIPVWASHSTFHFLLLIHWICEEYGMCSPTVTSWGNPAEGMGDCFHLHCQAGGWDRIGCSFLGYGSRTLLDNEAPTWLVFGDWAISVRVWNYQVDPPHPHWSAGRSLSSWSLASFLATMRFRSFPTEFCIVRMRYPFSLWWSFPAFEIDLKILSVLSSGI